MRWWERGLIWAGLRAATHSPEGLPLIALDCGHEAAAYARSTRTERTACWTCYHAAILPSGSRGF